MRGGDRVNGEGKTPRAAQRTIFFTRMCLRHFKITFLAQRKVFIFLGYKGSFKRTSFMYAIKKQNNIT